MRGSELPHAKLNEAKVREARALHAEAMETIEKLRDVFGVQGLADRYGVDHSTMLKAIKGITWRHVK